MTSNPSATPSPDKNNPALTPEQAKTLISEAISLHRQGNLEQAEKRYRQVLGHFPDHANALQLLGVLKGATGDLQVAANMMEKSLSINPEQHHVRLNLARTYGRQKEYEKALQVFRHACESTPENPEPFHGIGTIYEAMGKPQEAMEAYRQALQKNGNHFASAINLGVLLLSYRQHEKAKELFEKALSLQPHNTSALNGMGTCLQQQGKVAEAVQYFKTAIGHNPHSGEAYCNLGFAQYELRQYEESAKNCQKAVELSPDSAVAHNNYAITLHALGEVEKSETMARRAVELDPGYANAFNNLGNALQAQGRKDEAFEAYRQATRINPGYAQAYRNMAQVVKFTEGQQPIIDEMEALRQNPQAGETEQMHIGFALGKAYGDRKQPDLAFSHYATGNRLARKTMHHSTKAIQLFFNEIKSVYSADFAASAPDSGIDDSTPFFILGMPRSGTTLTEQILASHRAVHGAEELSYMGKIVNAKAGKWFKKPFPCYVPDLGSEQLAKIGHAYLEKLRLHSADAAHITDKMPANFQFIGLILQSLPKAKIIHCKRNPMDNCFSIFKYYFVGSIPYAYDLTELGEYYRLYEDLMNHWKTLYGDRIFEVEYEKMTESPETLIPQLLEFCGLEWNDACLDFHNTKRDVRTASAMQVRQPIYKTSVEAWRPYETHLKPLQEALQKPPYPES